MSTLKIARRTSQIVVALGIPALYWLGVQEWEYIRGNFLSFSIFGYPVADPLAALQVAMGGNLPWRMVLGGGTVLAVAFVLGTVFCSWACPFGLLSELVAGRKRVAAKNSGWRVKWLVTGFFLIAVAVFGLPPLANQVSLPGWYSRLFQTWLNQRELAGLGFVLVVGALVVEILVGRRVWCRFVCPQSVLLNLAHRFSPVALRVRFAPSRCSCAKGDEMCLRACTLGLEPRLAGKGLEWQCSTCGDCTGACAQRGKALTLGFGREAGASDEKKSS